VRDGVRIGFSDGPAAQGAFDALRDGEPSIWTRLNAGNLSISVAFLAEGEAEVVARRLREVLEG
jgi:hypothetical protein